MLELVRLEASHMERLRSVGALHYMSEEVGVHTLKELEKSPFSHSILMDGVPIACGGIVVYWKDRGEIWGFVDKVLAKGHGKEIIELVRPLLDGFNIRRIEAAVDSDDGRSRRFAEALGFKWETERAPYRGFDGSDQALYSRIKWPQPQS